MIEVVMKRLGTYQYRWDNVVSGDDELREALNSFSDEFMGDDVNPVTVRMSSGSYCSVRLYRSLNNVNEIHIPADILRTAMDVKFRSDDDAHGDPHLVEHYDFSRMEIQSFNTPEKTYAEITFIYDMTAESAKRVFSNKK